MWNLVMPLSLSPLKRVSKANECGSMRKLLPMYAISTGGERPQPIRLWRPLYQKIKGIKRVLNLVWNLFYRFNRNLEGSLHDNRLKRLKNDPSSGNERVRTTVSTLTVCRAAPDPSRAPSPWAAACILIRRISYFNSGGAGAGLGLVVLIRLDVIWQPSISGTPVVVGFRIRYRILKPLWLPPPPISIWSYSQLPATTTTTPLLLPLLLKCLSLRHLRLSILILIVPFLRYRHP